MLKAENIYVAGFEPALRGMRNPKDSWDRSDSYYVTSLVTPNIDVTVKNKGSVKVKSFVNNTPTNESDVNPIVNYTMNVTDANNNESEIENFDVLKDGGHILRKCKDHDGNESTFLIEMDKIPILGENDLKLMKTLTSGGPVHGKFTRMINVYIDITASFDFWKEADTYRFGKECNSCSTMHRITKNPISIDNYSTADLRPEDIEFMKNSIEYYQGVLDDNSLSDVDKTRILSKINMTGFEQKRTLMLSYETIHNMCTWRRGHKLEEWRYLTNEIFMKLPYFKYLYFTK